MKITNLNHIEAATQDVTGAGGHYYHRKPSAKAYADADALAIGYKTYTRTYTNVEAVAGVYSASSSSSYASAK